MGSDLFAPGAFQDSLQSLADRGWVSGRVLVDWRREHPLRGYRRSVLETMPRFPIYRRRS